jgi:hypothetical protein
VNTRDYHVNRPSSALAQAGGATTTTTTTAAMARLLLGVSLLAMGLRLGCAYTVVSFAPLVSDDVPALLAFKKAIYGDTLAALSDWNSSDMDPCWWSGVTCSELDNRVVALELSNSSLSGFLAPEIGNLSSLQTLVLDHNALAGSIPREIGKLKNLTVLNLSTNQLEGAIPSETGDMQNISTIDLHANRLNGTIPPELGKLANLKELRLSNNSLTGTIPGSNDSTMVSTGRDDQIGLCRLAQLTDIDLSDNFLAGSIPACFKHIQRSRMAGNCFQNNDTMNRPPGQCTVMFHF